MKTQSGKQISLIFWLTLFSFNILKLVLFLLWAFSKWAWKNLITDLNTETRHRR